jgi:pimeloyl-ACP methyl ester carboxylesterase
MEGSPLKHPIALTLSALTLLIGCGGSKQETGLADASLPDPRPDAPDADVGTHPRVDTVACRYEIPTQLGLSAGTDYECGDLITFEDRNSENSTIRVHFVRFFSQANSNNATIYFEGGPGGNGGSMVARLGRLGNDFLNALMVDGDFIVIAQRGTTLSVPSLDCEWIGECQQLTGDLPAYNTAYNADDVNEIRSLLGYEKLNLFGISYGSRLALEVMRRHGEHIRSSIIGGIVPSHVVWSAGIPRSFYSALTALNASCADHGSCGAAYGDLEADFIAGITALNDEPVVLDNGNIGLDGYTYASLLFQFMYSNSTYPWLPLMISDLAESRVDRVESYLVDALYATSNASVARGMYYSVVCGEMFSPPNESLFDQVNADVPSVIRDIFSGSWYRVLDTCSEWPTGSLQTELAEPVSSDLPTFVASGTMDPITPPSYGVAAAETLSNALVVDYQNSGHGSTVQSDCGRDTFLAFLADPSASIDVSCASAMTTSYLMPNQAVAASIDMQAYQWDLQMTPPMPEILDRVRSAIRKH